MRYVIRGIDADNRIIDLEVEAETSAEALARGRECCISVLGIKSAGATMTSSRSRQFSLLLFSQEMKVLLRAGLSLIEALEALAENVPVGQTRAVLARLIARIRAGEGFSRALETMPQVFPTLFVGLIRAAESNGDLPSALARYIDYRQRVDGVRGKIVSASIYPAILMVVGSAVTFFLAGYVVPRFAAVYQDSGRDLPGPSKLLLAVGSALNEDGSVIGLAIFAAIFAAGGGLYHMHRTGALSSMLSRLPAVGGRIRLYELSRLYLTLGLLVEAGTPLVQAMAMACSVVSAETSRQLSAARRDIQAGAPFASSMNDHSLTTSVSKRMFSVGEQSGQLGRLLVEAAAFHDADVARFVDRFTRAFEPTLMALIGLVVGGIVLLLYMPIFDLAGSIQ